MGQDAYHHTAHLGTFSSASQCVAGLAWAGPERGVCVPFASYPYTDRHQQAVSRQVLAIYKLLWVLLAFFLPVPV